MIEENTWRDGLFADYGAIRMDSRWIDEYSRLRNWFDCREKQYRL